VLALLLEVAADYTRLSGVRGQVRVSGALQDLGMSIDPGRMLSIGMVSSRRDLRHSR
jgi:hypothetical protein